MYLYISKRYNKIMHLKKDIYVCVSLNLRKKEVIKVRKKFPMDV